VVVEDGHLRRAPAGRRLYLQPGYDSAAVPAVRSHFDRYSTVRFDHYTVRGLPNAALTLA
jgi:hypothetical protein